PLGRGHRPGGSGVGASRYPCRRDHRQRMSRDYVWSRDLQLDVQFGYLDPAVDGPRRFNPKVVLNSDSTSVLRTIREELRHCDEFLFSVAFVSPRAIALLKQELVEFKGRGHIVTSDYLSLNSPAAFAELLNL